MGKGDKKSKKGKIIMGSYGKKRPRKLNKSIITDVAAENKSKKGDKKKIEEPIDIQQEHVTQTENTTTAKVVSVEEKKVAKKTTKTTTDKKSDTKTTAEKKTTTKKVPTKKKTDTAE
jgi:30S ribosomal protein S31